MSDDPEQAGPQENWSGTIQYTPAGYYEPANLWELIQIVRNAHANKVPIRPRGSGHSWNPAIATSADSINTKQLTPGNCANCICKGKPEGQRPCGRISCMDVTWQTIWDSNGEMYYLMGVPAGITQGELSQRAQNNGCPLPTQGPALDITLSGFVANGCHGTGWDQPTIAELVYGIEIMGPDGELLYFDENTVPDKLSSLGIAAPDLMNIVRVNLGALGIITRIVFKLKPDPFHLKLTNRFVPLTDIFDPNDPSKLQQLLEGHDYVEIFWFPYNNFAWKDFSIVPRGPEQDILWVMQADRTTEPLSWDESLVNGWNDAIGALAKLGGMFGDVMALVNETAPVVAKFAVETMKLKACFDAGVVFNPRDVFLYQKTYFTNFLDFEQIIPMDGDQGFKNVVDAFYQLVNRMEAWRTQKHLGRVEYPVNLNVHARFVKNSQALLSPAYAAAGSQTHTCYIEYLSYSNGRLQQQYIDFTQDFFSADNGNGWKAFGGLPNWGKFVQCVPGFFSYAYDILNATSGSETESRLARFLQVRDAIDPGGATFTNSYLQDVFTGNDAGVIRSSPERSVAEASLPARSLPNREFEVETAAFEALAGRVAEVTLNGAGLSRLRHEPASNVAYLIDEHGRLHVLGYTHESASKKVTYHALAVSEPLSSDQVLDRVGRFITG